MSLAPPAASERSEAALAQRLRAIAGPLGVEAPALEAGASGHPSTVALLEDVARAVAADPRMDRVWLLLVGLTGAFPLAETVTATRRALRLSAVPWLDLLRAFQQFGAGRASLHREIEVVSDVALVDVDFCAKHEHNTGIQRVVRHTVPFWIRGGRPARLAVWTEGDLALRAPTPREESRVLAWGRDGAPTEDDSADLPVLVPYGTTVVLPEVPQAGLCAPLASLAEHSGNEVVLVGYDMIPIVSADAVSPEETERFTRYLTIVKHSDRVAGISASAADEFAGFSAAVASQGLAGPSVFEIALPMDRPEGAVPGPEESDRPLVVVIGSHEPRKNHLAILQAATLLWDEGLRFSLRFIGGGSGRYTALFDRAAAAANREGGRVEILRRADDRVLLSSIVSSRFTMFPSLHEGYGLPLAESLTLGVPAIATDYGSTAEIAAGGGCLLVDPRDDRQMHEAMRRLLVDDEEVARLRGEISERTFRSWREYSDELWDRLVAPATDRGTD